MTRDERDASADGGDGVGSSGERGADETASDHADVFAALSDPTRVAILRALWEAEDHRASFSTLRETVGEPDSGKFNYHLGKLRDAFVTKTDDGRYRLRRAGYDVVGSLIAGTYEYGGELGPVPSDEPCPLCGGSTELHYDGELLSIECVEDDRPEDVTIQLPMPRNVLRSDDPAAVSETARNYARSLIADVRSGFCIHCEGPTTAAVTQRPADAGAVAGDPLVETTCPHCGETITLDLGVYFAEHPAVVSFYFDHGLDVRDVPLAETASFGDEHTTVTDDPVRATVRYTADGDALDLTVDKSATVLDATRRID